MLLTITASSASEKAIVELRAEISVTRAELRFQRWVNMTTLGLVLAVLVKLFVH